MVGGDVDSFEIPAEFIAAIEGLQEKRLEYTKEQDAFLLWAIDGHRLSYKNAAKAWCKLWPDSPRGKTTMRDRYIKLKGEQDGTVSCR